MEKAKCLGVLSVFVLLALFCSIRTTSAQSELAAKVEELADKLTSSVSGEVASAEGEIIINLGEKDCVYEGARFEVVRLGEIIIVGNKPIHKERPVGEIEITKVRKEMSYAKAATSYAQIEKGDKVYQKRRKVSRIALTEFPYADNLNNLTKNVYESLSIAFAQKGMQVVERSQLEKVLHEQKIAHSGLIDIGTAKRLGQLLASEGMVLGTATDMGNYVAIRARLVDVGKGVVITAAQVEVMKNPEVMAMLDTRIGTLRTTGGSSPHNDTAGKGQKEDSFYENDFVRIEVLSFSRQPDGLVLKLKYTNRTNKPFQMILERHGHDKTYLVDDAGNQYACKEGEMMQRNGIEFPPQVPRISTLVFRDQKDGGHEFIFSSKYQTWDLSTREFFASISRLRLQ
jgi:curli biogenesis system outer membrane secretion channel CsgG